MATFFPGGGTSVASSLGSSLGTGIGSALQGLAEGFAQKQQVKLQQQQQQEQQAQQGKLFELLGLPAQLATAPPVLQNTILKNFVEEGGLERLQQQQSQQPAQQQPLFQSGAQGQQPSGVDQLQNIQQQQAAERPAIPQELSPQVPAEQNVPSIQRRRVQDSIKPTTRETLAQQTQQMRTEEPGKILQRKPIGKTQREFHKEAQKEQRNIDKDTKPFFEKTIKESRSAKKSNLRLSRMKELIKRGRLTDPAIASAIKTLSKGIFGIGLDLNFLKSADSQEFDKLTTDFLKNAKDVFGSRLTNFDVETFLKTLPSLSQTDEGKLRVLRNLELFNEADLAQTEVMKKLISQNGGRRPRNLELDVEEQMSETLDKIAEQFKLGSEEKPSSKFSLSPIAGLRNITSFLVGG